VSTLHALGGEENNTSAVCFTGEINVPVDSKGIIYQREGNENR